LFLLIFLEYHSLMRVMRSIDCFFDIIEYYNLSDT